MKAAVLGLIGLGFLLLVLSGIWTTLFPGTAAWTPEKSARLAEIRSRLHNLGFVVDSPSARVSMHGGPDPVAAKEESERLMKEREQLAAEFETAHDRPHTIASTLKWTGITLAGLGILGWLAVRES